MFFSFASKTNQKECFATVVSVQVPDCMMIHGSVKFASKTLDWWRLFSRVSAC